MAEALLRDLPVIASTLSAPEEIQHRSTQKPSGGSSGSLKTRLSRHITERRCVVSGLGFLAEARSSLLDHTNEARQLDHGNQRDR